MSTQPKRYITPEEYLEIERKAEFKSQYFRGEMFAMAGATREHILISQSVSLQIGLQIRNRRCELYSSEMRVLVSETGLYTYPDIVVVCDEPKFVDQNTPDTLLNPTLVMEILSQSTREYDEIGKFEHYRSIDSLQEYVLVDQYRPLIKQYSRSPDNQWSSVETSSVDEMVTFRSIDCTMLVKDVYHKITFKN